MSVNPDEIIFLAQQSGNDKIESLNLTQTEFLLEESPILKGPTGTGVPGPAGAQGANGSVGSTGVNGPTGPLGPTGNQGVDGPTGMSIIGPTGQVGPTGAQGAMGNQGAQGASLTGDAGPGPIGVSGADGGGVDLYVDLSDTPANFTDINQALVVNSAGTAVTHTSLRTRVASSNSVVLSADNTASLASSAGTVSGKYSMIACSNDALNTATNTRTAVIASSDSQAKANRSAVIASDQCVINNSGSNMSALGSDQCTLNASGQCAIQSYDCILGAADVYSAVISSNGCDTFDSFSAILASKNCYTRDVYTAIIGSSTSCDTRTKYSAVMFSRNSETDAEYSAIIASNKCYTDGPNTLISSSYDCNTTTSSKFSSIFASDNCTINGDYDFIAASVACSCSSTANYCAEISCNNCDFTSSRFSFMTSSLNCDISGDYSVINASNNCSTDENFNRIIACKDSSITSTPSNHNLIAACDNCDITAGDGNQVFIGASKDCRVASSTVNNSMVLASYDCDLSGGNSQMAIIGCEDVTCSADNAAIIGCVGATYNNSTAYTVRVRQVRAYSFTMISDESEKKDIVPVEVEPDLLDKVMELPVSEFRLKTDPHIQPIRRGFIAQDAQKIFPEIVNNKKYNYKKVFRKDTDVDVWYTDRDFEKQFVLENGTTVEVDQSNPLLGTATTETDSEYLTIDSRELSSLIFKTLKVLTEEYQENCRILDDLLSSEEPLVV